MVELLCFANGRIPLSKAQYCPWERSVACLAMAPNNPNWLKALSWVDLPLKEQDQALYTLAVVTASLPTRYAQTYTQALAQKTIDGGLASQLQNFVTIMRSGQDLYQYHREWLEHNVGERLPFLPPCLAQLLQMYMNAIRSYPNINYLPTCFR